MSTREAEAGWVQQFSVADQAAIEAMDPDTRALVERYARANRVEKIGDLEDRVVDELADELRDTVRRVISRMRRA